MRERKIRELLVMRTMGHRLRRAAGGGLLCAPVVCSVCLAAAPVPQARAANIAGRSAALADGRVYEQVSPADKNGNDAVGAPGNVFSAPSGERVTFFSLLPFPGVPGAGDFVTYLSSRGSTGWSTTGLLPLSEPGHGATFGGLTEDLGQTLAYSSTPLTEEPGARPGVNNSYLRNSATGSYRLLAPFEAKLDGTASAGTQVLFEDEAQLPGFPNAHEFEGPNLYELDGAEFQLVGVLNDGTVPAGGAQAGAGEHSGDSRFYSQNAISEDGTRVFFTAVGTGQVYVREPDAGKTVAVSQGPAVWRASTPDGAAAFYTEAGELYRFDVATEQREKLTAPPNGSAGVLGTLGISDDGAYAYFVATAALANGAAAGRANLYEWHEGATTFVATLSNNFDKDDWAGFVSDEPSSASAGQKGSRVTSDGTTVLFASREQLTGYDNAGHSELYLHHAGGGTSLACVSCNPSGTPPTSDAWTNHNASESSGPAGSPLLTRNLSDDGRRVFFETAEALLPQDTNGVDDVYEWESGSLYLVSTGRSASVSFFADASANGNDVFFFTRQALVGQDQDNNSDLYDARVGGGIAAQNPPPPTPPCAAEACRGALGTAPGFGAPASSTFSGFGNVPPPAPVVKQAPVAKRPSRTQQLAKALKACKRKPRRKRAACIRQAKKKYGHGAKRPTHAHKTARRHLS